MITQRLTSSHRKLILSNFYITYYAKKHSKFVPRKASEPNPEGTAGREFVDKNGVNRYIYWDLEAINKKTKEPGDWRHATGSWKIKTI